MVHEKSLGVRQILSNLNLHYKNGIKHFHISLEGMRVLFFLLGVCEQEKDGNRWSFYANNTRMIFFGVPQVEND